VRSYSVGQRACVFRLRDHTARLFRSARMLGLSIPAQYDAACLDRVQIEVLRKNRLGDAYLRPFVFYGGTRGLSRDVRGLDVHVAVLALEWKGHPAAAPRREGVSLRTSTFTRHHGSLLAKAKANANYMSGILALQEAQACGADEALLLDTQGFVTETSGSNVFCVQDGVIHTPPVESVLEGITRHTVIELARRAGWTVLERRLTRDELYAADEIFLTGTAAEVTPVLEFDGRPVGDEGPGPTTTKLRDMYAALTRGRDAHRPEWLTWLDLSAAAERPSGAESFSTQPS
jgi:branched-chain amino acid aminotransferase